MSPTKTNKSPLHIEIDAAPWRKVRGLKRQLEKAAGVTLGQLPESLKPLARRSVFTLLLTSDAAVRRLNHDFRGMDKPTNVLSFPHLSRNALRKIGQGREAIYVGDIAAAYHYAAAEAKAEHKNLKDHVTHLMIHGILHLFGYDHHTDAAAMRMERLEKRIMAKLGLPDPYAQQQA
jgi:probable rRNA maturation factor